MPVSPYEFDYRYWHDILPFRLPLDWYPRNGDYITSPVDAIVAEAMRKIVLDKCDVGRPTPTDVFVFGKGEPARRDMTKIGGVPYRPADVAWPRTPDGLDFIFVAQLRFSESRDIIGATPGDLLLMFAPFEGVAPGDEMHFEWYPLGLDNLVSAADVPIPSWKFATCYGQRFRTADYPDVEAQAAAESVFQDENEWDSFFMFRYKATKIGGSPPMVDEIEASVELPGRFLGSIASVCPVTKFAPISLLPELPYPWVNSLPDDASPDSEERFLEWGDSGFVFLSLDSDNQVHWTGRTY